MSWRVLGPLAGAIAIAGAVVALLAPSNGRVIDPVAKAADTTAAAGTAAFELSGSVSAAGQDLPLSGNGVVDMGNSHMRMTMSVPIPNAGKFELEEIFDGSAIYMRMPSELTRRMPGGKPWMKMDLKAIGKAAGVDLEQAMQANQSNPGDMLGALKGVADSEVVGHEAIRGADTTHYHADVDMKKALDKMPTTDGGERLKRMVDSTGMSSMPVDVWIDGNGRVAREAMKMSLGGAAVGMTIDYTRFGVPVDVTAPPSDQVFDAAALLSSLGGQSG